MLTSVQPFFPAHAREKVKRDEGFKNVEGYGIKVLILRKHKRG